MQNPDISFLQLKIANIGTALFYCGAQSQLPFSTYIITALKIDDGGYIWFFVNRGLHQQTVTEKPFDTQLEFYRKGYPFSMKIEGEAYVTDPREKMQDLMGKGISLPQDAVSGILLVKVKIEKVIYKDLKEPKTFRPLTTISSWLKNMVSPVVQQLQHTPSVS